jgi:hypothetical protein
MVSANGSVARKTLLGNGSVVTLVLATVTAQLYGVFDYAWSLCLIAVIMVAYVMMMVVCGGGVGRLRGAILIVVYVAFVVVVLWKA